MRVARRHVTSALVAGILSILLTGAVLAQEATPQETPESPVEGYPVTIHDGTCDDPGAEPVFEIGNAVSLAIEGDPGVQIIGDQVDPPVFEASGTIEATFDDLVDPTHVIAIHAGPDDFDNIVACGEVAGVVNNEQVVIALTPLGEATVTGVVLLESVEEGQIQVTAYIYNLGQLAEATPTD